MDPISGILLIVMCLIFPPLAVGLSAGCSADLLISLFLTLFLWFPAVIHAFYILWVSFDRQAKFRSGNPPAERAPFVFSDRIQNGGTRVKPERPPGA